MGGEARADFVGTRRFKIERRLGAGGMGVVYAAYDRANDTSVALKTLRYTDASTIYRFKNEFRALQDLEHPNLVSLGELFEDAGEWFFTMELIDGVDVVHFIRGEADDTGDSDSVAAMDNTLAPEAAPAHGAIGSATARAGDYDEARLRASLGQLALGLFALHSAGKVHRDIKPSNILVTDEGRLVLLDFGLIADTRTSRRTGDEAVGTAAFMAPEQAAAKPVEPAADWYSVGVLLYQVITGRLPFTGASLQVMIDKQQHTPPPPRAHWPAVPPDLDELCAELLRTDPSARPSGREVLRRLGVSGAIGDLSSSTSRFSQRIPFVGRDAELDQLRAAFTEAREHGAVTVFVHGQSGIGKSELVTRAADLMAHDGALVLRGRCYEREAVPYKAFDGVADAIGRFLEQLPTTDAAALLPERSGLLGRLFPVLARVEVIARESPEVDAKLDPQELRTRMFTALRQLLTAMAQHQPLVLFIDDFQWADADSLTLLDEVMHPPDAPPLLLVATVRTDLGGDDEAPALPTLDGDVRYLPIAPLDPAAARELVERLSPTLVDEYAGADEIARETAGHPMFIHELVRYLEQSGAGATNAMRLDDALWSRVLRLREPALSLLEVIAVAGAPVAQNTMARAAGLDYSAYDKAASVLRVAFLARTTGRRHSDTIEAYHDRVREAVLAHVDDERRAHHHGALARALEHAGAATTDPHVLVRHFEAAGEAARAARHAEQAARRATHALAFDQAAALFGVALRLGNYDDDSRRELLLSLADALVNAGRGRAAADALLEAAEGAEPTTRLECRRTAAEQLLISGHIEEGLGVMRTLLDELGVSFPRSPRRALTSLLWHRFKLRMRGLGWTERHESEIPRSTLLLLDVHEAIARGLGVVDLVRGSDFQARGLLLALKTGEKTRVGRALGQEAAFLATNGTSATARCRELAARARQIAESTGDPHLCSTVDTVDAVIDYFNGMFSRSSNSLAAIEKKLVDIPGATWELDNARLFRVFAIMYLGDMNEQRTLIEQIMRDAARRGDRYAETSTRLMGSITWLARDDPEGARRDLERVSWSPPEGAFHLQHCYELEARGQLVLYEGRSEDADAVAALWQRFDRLARTLLLQVQMIRSETTWLDARLALIGADKRQAIRKARAAVRRLEREPIAYIQSFAALLRAGIAGRIGNLDEAVVALAAATDACEQAELHLCAQAARRRHGLVLGGDEGRALVEAADAWMTENGIANPAKMAGMYLPGFASD